MDVTWADTFMNKHVVIVDKQGMALTEMVAEGMRIYAGRLAGGATNVQAYGKTRPSETHGNTVVITSQAGFLEMESWVRAHGKKGAKQTDNHIPVRIGAIVTGKSALAVSGVNPGGGTIHVQIEMPNAQTKHVMHLSSGESPTLTGSDVDERANILKGHLGGKDPGAGHFKTLNEIIRHIDRFETGV